MNRNIENAKFVIGDLKASGYNLSLVKDIENLIKDNERLIEKTQYYKYHYEKALVQKKNLKKENTILKRENAELSEKVKMFIPRRRVRRIYKMIGEILQVDVDPEVLERELKKEKKK